MRAMGLDVGDKRIGIALSDESGLIAQPFEVYERNARTSPYEYIIDLARDQSVDTIVVGLPLSMNAEESAQTAAMREFVRGLKKRMPREVCIVVQDERLSSAASERALLEADMGRSDRRQIRDKIAAAIILQSWLDARAKRKVENNE